MNELGWSCVYSRLFHSSDVSIIVFFFFNDTATTEIYTLSLHDALPISRGPRSRCGRAPRRRLRPCRFRRASRDRKSTRLNSSHSQISYAVFCLKKKKKTCVAFDEPSPPSSPRSV